jgi:ankyrin repeat protein
MEIKSNLLERRYGIAEKIMFYIKDGNYRKFKSLYDNNINLTEAKDQLENTLLNIAVQSNNMQISKYLIENGAKVNTQNVIINNLDLFKFSFTLCVVI